MECDLSQQGRCHLKLDRVVQRSGMRIRVVEELCDAFAQACRAQDRAAADVLRDFMRGFTEKQQQGQATLFAGTKRK